MKIWLLKRTFYSKLLISIPTLTHGISYRSSILGLHNLWHLMACPLEINTFALVAIQTKFPKAR
jgi:hypothetical protein